MTTKTVNGRPMESSKVFEEGDYWRWLIVMKDGTEYTDGGNFKTQDEAAKSLAEAFDQ